MKKEIVINRATAIVVFVYILFVLWGQYALFDTIFPSIPIGIAVIAITFALTKILLRWCGTWRLKLDEEAPGSSDIKKLAGAVFGISFGCLLVFYYAKFPGMYFLDSVYQLNQSISGAYDDWHPLLQTLLTFTIPYKLGGVWLIELVQLLFYAGALTYMICSLRWYRCPGWLCIGVFVYLMLQPDTAYIMIFPMKDCAFAILSLLLMTELLHIVSTEGMWFSNKINVIFFVITWVVGTVIRHNAILFTVPLLLAVIFVLKNQIKRIAVVLIVLATLLLTIKIPFYGLFHMEPNEYRVTETMGMSMVMMGNVLCEMPEFMSEEAKEYMYAVQDKEIWEEYYKLGDWNEVKCYDGGANFEVMDKVGRKKILEYTADTIMRCPEYSIKAFLAVTGMVWQIDGDRRWEYSLRKYYNNQDGSIYDNTPATDALKKYSAELPLQDAICDTQEIYIDVFSDSFLKYIFCYVGLLDFILIVVCMAKVRTGLCVRRVLYILPIIIYNYGTALLLSAYDNRFFYYTFGCFFVCMFLILKEDCRVREN